MANSAALELILELTDNASKGLEGVQKELEGTSAKANILQTVLGVVGGGLISKGIDAVTGAFGDLKSGMIDGNAEFERYQVQFGVLLGGADKAKQRLADLADFGAKTPFELPEVVQADKILQGFGLHSEESAKKFGFSGKEILTIAGDLAAGTGADFTEISNDIGKLGSGATGEAISRFQELGIVTREELTKMGLQFSKSGELTSPLPKAMNTVLTAMKQKFGGMMDAQSSTFEGMISNLEDWKGQTLRTIGAPIFDVLKTQLSGLLAFLGSDAVHGAVDGFAHSLADGIGGAMTWLTTTAIPALVGGWQSIAPTISAVVTAFQDAASYIGTDGLGAAISTLGADLGELNPAVGGFISALAPLGDMITVVGQAFLDAASSFSTDGIGAALSTLGADLSELNPTIGGFISALAPIGDVLDNLIAGLQGTGPYASAMAGAFQLIADNAGLLVPILEAVGVAFAAFSIISTVVGWVTGLIGAFGAVGAAIEASGGIIAAIVAVLGGPLTIAIVAVAGAIALLVAAWVNNWGDIQGKTAAVWGFIQPILGELGAWLNTHIPAAIAIVSAYWTGTLQPAMSVVGAFITGTIFPILQALVSTYFALVKAEVAVVAAVWTGVLQPALAAVGGFLSGFLFPLLQALASVYIALVKVEVAALAAIWTGVLQPALATVGGYISGALSAAFAAISSFVTGTVMPALSNLASTASGTLSPALSGLGGIASSVSGWLNGIGAAAQGVIGWINGVASTINSVQIPSWLQGHSPPPMAEWFDYIAGAASGAAETMPAFSGAIGEATGPVNALKQNVQGAVGALQNQFGQLPGVVQGSLASIGEALAQQEQAAQRLGPEIGQLGDLQTHVDDTMTETTDTMQSAVPDAQDAGHDIVKGVVEGASSVHDELVDYAHHLVQDMIDEMRSTAQAASPSQATADNVGAPMAQGIAAGMESESGNLNESASTLVSDSVDAMGGSVSTLDDVGIPMIQGVVDGLIAMEPELEAAIGTLSGDSQSAFKQWLDDVHKLIDESFQSIIDQANDLFSAVGNAAKMFDSQRYADDVAAGYDKIAQLQDELTQNTTDQQAAQEALNAATQQYNQDQQDLIALQDQQKQNAKELADAQQKQTDLENQKAVLQAQIDSGQIDEATGKAQMKALDKQIAAQNDVVNAAQKAYNDTQKQIADTQKDITDQQQIQKDSQKDINTLLDEQRKKQEEYNTQLEKNNDLLYQQTALRQVQESEMSQIRAAQEEAAKIADPTEAAKYLQIQLDFYEKYYDLQAQMIKAGDNTQQIEYLKQQQALLVQAHDAALEQLQYEMDTTKSTAEDVAAGTTATSKDAATRKTLDELNNTIGNLNNILAKGIEVTVTQGHASGTEYAPGGWSWVGEKGPELMYVPQGSQIYAHGDSPGGGGASYAITIDARGASDPQAIEAAGYRGAKRALEEVGATAQIRKRAR